MILFRINFLNYSDSLNHISISSNYFISYFRHCLSTVLSSENEDLFCRARDFDILAPPAVLPLRFEGRTIVEHVLSVGLHSELGKRQGLQVECGWPLGYAYLGLHGVSQGQLRLAVHQVGEGSSRKDRSRWN